MPLSGSKPIDKVMFRVGRIIPLTGLVSGRLTVRGPSHWEQDNRGTWQLYWRCDCSCGGTCLVLGSKLRTGHTGSCGCFSRERFSQVNKTHGLRSHPIYKRWHEMLRRCQKPKAAAYSRYGGRGITVDPAWLDFAKFHSDMAASFQPGLTLERVDNSGPYSKANCIWATAKQQNNNTRVNRRITINGITKNLSQWVEGSGVAYPTVHKRIKRGWSAEEAIKP